MTITDDDVYDYLEHFGVKGMKWGVRKERTSSSPDSSQKEGWSNKKKAAVILGSAAVAASLIAGGIYAKKHFNVKMANLPKSSAPSKKLSESLAKEPVSLIHASRGKTIGFSFLQRGGLEDPLKEYMRSGLESADIEQSKKFFSRYGDRNEKIALRFMDPLGRKDQSGRAIPHEALLPESLAKGVNSHEEAVAKVWPLIKDTYEAIYDAKHK